jgi:hypothetical protein
VPRKVKNSLEAIIKLSRQLLSQLEIQIKNYESVDLIGNNPAIDISDLKGTEQKLLTGEQLLMLVTERQSLITSLFKVHTQEQLSIELALINEMVLLDEKLTFKSQNHKKTLATQVLQLKRSKKVSNLYKKY